MLLAARSFTDLMAPVQNVTTDHDVGFVAFCSYGQGLRVLRAEERRQAREKRREGEERAQGRQQRQQAGPEEAGADAAAGRAASPEPPPEAAAPSADGANPTRASDLASYRAALLRAADALATRFHPVVGATESWDWWGKRGHDYPVIVDNLMNMELLFWAEKEHARAAGELRARARTQRGWAAEDRSAADEAEDRAAAGASAAAAADAERRAGAAADAAGRLRRVAEAHVRTTLRNHFRDDAGGTAWHLVNYDPQTGAVRRRQNYQGYDDDSLWARGQGWALYGHSFAFRETRDRLFLRRAVRLAQFLYSHPNMPSDGVPYWDLADPRIPDVPRDASAGAIYASALYELSRHVRGDEGDGLWDGGALLSPAGGGGGGGGNGTAAAAAANATAAGGLTFPVAPPGAEAAADARWASLSPQQREAAGDGLRARLRGLADRTLRSLADAAGPYRETVVGANDGFVLRHSVGSLNEKLMLEIDAPLNYADYYFLEAMLRRVQTRAELEERRRQPAGAQ